MILKKLIWKEKETIRLWVEAKSDDNTQFRISDLKRDEDIMFLVFSALWLKDLYMFITTWCVLINIVADFKKHESLILAQNERWRRASGMQVERESSFGDEYSGARVSNT